ncbi:hypothetical protein, partial [Siphonobacter sp.]|uniref:hypothetical protein n=1 Tax=Siphonobacter sp. TaxID=1869184 RepID=UPI003B3A7CB4
FQFHSGTIKTPIRKWVKKAFSGLCTLFTCHKLNQKIVDLQWYENTRRSTTAHNQGFILLGG